MSAFDPKRTFGSQAFCTAMDHFREAALTRYDAPVLGRDKAMKRRSKAGGKTGKLRGRTASAPMPKATRRRRSPATPQTEIVRVTQERDEALEQQRASAEVLNVISNSLSDAEPVFEKIVESCERIFATNRIGLNLIGPDGLVHAGAYGKFPSAENLRRENFPHPVPGSATGAAISAGSPIQYPDALSGPDVPQYGRRAAKILSLRAFLISPLLSEGRRCDLRWARGDWLVLRQRGRAPEDLRRPGGYRHREHAAVKGTAPDYGSAESPIAATRKS
jgi:hypothetical protein